MTRERWEALVEQARGCDMIMVAQHYGAKLWKRGAEFVGACPRCGTGHDRFSIHPAKGLFNCRVCGEGGHGPVDLEMFLGGGDFVAAAKRLTGVISLSGRRAPATEKAIATEAEKFKRDRERARDEAEQHEVAAWLWSKRQPPENSAVASYLAARGYLGPIPPTIAYLPASENRPHAMISAFAMPNEIAPGKLGEPVIDTATASVHITRLLPDGSDRIRDDKGKIIIGRPLGLPIVLSCIGDGLSLVITEGIEDALAFIAAGFQGAWAAGSAPFFPALAEHIPDYVTSIIIEVHPDEAAQNFTVRLQTLLAERPVRPRPKDSKWIERPIEIHVSGGAA